MNRLLLLCGLTITLQSTVLANEYPDKCRSGSIVKRDMFYQSGISSPFRRDDSRWEQAKFEVSIDHGKYRYSYMNCWSDGYCEWIDTRWSRLGKSSHGAFQTKHGYSGFYGTMKNSDSVYVCWYRVERRYR